MKLPRLHLVTDDSVLTSPDFEKEARDVVHAYGTRLALHIRARNVGGGELYRLALALIRPARKTGATVLVNDRVDVAMASGVDGAHLGHRSFAPMDARKLLGSEALIGISTHGVGEARKAGAGADYVFFGSVYATRSHPGAVPAGLESLRRAVLASHDPVIGIGGMTPERVPHVLGTGAHGVAVLSGVWGSRNVLDAVEAYMAALADAEAGSGENGTRRV